MISLAANRFDTRRILVQGSGGRTDAVLVDLCLYRFTLDCASSLLWQMGRMEDISIYGNGHNRIEKDAL